MNGDSSNAAFNSSLRRVLGKRVSNVDLQLKGHFLSVEGLYFLLHFAFVGGNGFGHDFLYQGHVALANTHLHVDFHHLDQRLKNQRFEQFLVGGFVVLDNLNHLPSGFCVEVFHHRVHLLHLQNSSFVLVSGSLDSQLDLVLF